MNVSVSTEMYVFVMSAVSGVIVGAVFDVFRAIRYKVKQKPLSVGVQDILFWIIAAFIVFAFMYNINSGQPRWYIFAGAILGECVYAAVAGRAMVVFFAFVGTTLAKGILFVLKIFIFPFALFYKKVRKPWLLVALRVRGTLKRGCRFAKRVAKAPKKLKKRLKMY